MPAGATILGGGLGRDSQIATTGEKRSGAGWTAFEERSFEAFRAYYEYLPKGVVKMEYTLRLKDLLRVGDISANADLLPGDILIIPEGWF